MGECNMRTVVLGYIANSNNNTNSYANTTIQWHLATDTQTSTSVPVHPNIYKRIKCSHKRIWRKHRNNNKFTKCV